MITIVLIALNIIVYGLMLYAGVPFFNPTVDQILQWGGCNSATILHGESWRLLTAMFVHFGILHLFMNLYALYDLGITVERIIGKVRFIAIYLATGIFGGLVSQVWHLNTYSVEAGASGAVFGIVGVLIALLTTSLFSEEVRIPYLKRILVMVVINLGYGMQASVNMAAHMGGLLSGFILGYGIYYTMIQERKILRYAALFLIPLVTLASTTATLKYMKESDPIKFDEIVSEIHTFNEGVDGSSPSCLNFLKKLDMSKPTIWLAHGHEVKLACERTGFSLKDEKKPIMLQLTYS